MKFLLDTNTCIRFLTGRSPAILARLNNLPDNIICVCSVVAFELRFGALRSNNVEKTLTQQEEFLRRYKSLPFEDAAHYHAARIRADLARVGTPIGPYDLLIAAIALSNNLTLVTHNTGEFSRVTDLKIEDWETD